jgi:hypothetical protein
VHTSRSAAARASKVRAPGSANGSPDDTRTRKQQIADDATPRPAELAGNRRRKSLTFAAPVIAASDQEETLENPRARPHGRQESVAHASRDLAL